LKPLKASSGVSSAFNAIRKKVTYAKQDRAFYQDIDALRDMIRSGELLESVTKVTGDLEW